MGGLAMAKRKRGTEQNVEDFTVEGEHAHVGSKVSESKRKQQSEAAQPEGISRRTVKKKKKKLSCETLHNEHFFLSDPSSRGHVSNTQNISEREQHYLHDDAPFHSTDEHPDTLFDSIDRPEDAVSNAKTVEKPKKCLDGDFAVDNTEISGKSKGNDTKKKKVKKKRDKWGQVLSNAGNVQDTSADDNMLASVEPATNEHVNGGSGTDHEVFGEYDNKTVCAGGMPYDTTEAHIRNFFKNCGAIDNLVCLKFADTQKFKGLAFITFKTEAAATKALSLDGADMGGRFIKIEKARAGGKVLRPPPEREPGSLSVYIGNLKWDVKKVDIKRFFKGCDIDDVRLAVDKHTGDFRGYGHVDFSDEKSLERAIKMDQKQLLGRAIKVSYSVSKASK